MTTLQNASVTTKRNYGKTNLNKTGTTNRTLIQKATAFNKQFVNTVKHATKRTNRKVNKQTKKLHCEPILISNHQTTQAIKDTKNNNSTGPDNVNIRHLKHHGPLAINYLT